MSIEKRIEKLENYEESINPEKLTILKLQYDGVRDPTDEEIEAATKKFPEEHPGHKGHIVLDFLYLANGSDGDISLTVTSIPAKPFSEITEAKEGKPESQNPVQVKEA